MASDNLKNIMLIIAAVGILIIAAASIINVAKDNGISVGNDVPDWAKELESKGGTVVFEGSNTYPTTVSSTKIVADEDGLRITDPYNANKVYFVQYSAIHYVYMNA